MQRHTRKDVEGMAACPGWFQGNGGLVQFGWKPRNLARVLCEKIQVWPVVGVL